MGFKLKAPKVRAPSIKKIVKTATKVGQKLSPTGLSHAAITKTVGSKGVKFLDNLTGGTYSQSVRVGNLPGRAIAGEEIKKKDWIDAASYALKVGAVVSGGSLAGTATMMAKQYAAKELAKKVGGSAGSIIEAGSAVATGQGAGAAISAAAQSEAKKKAISELAKKGVGKEISSVAVAAYTGGSNAAIEATKSEARTSTEKEFEKKTGLPIGLANKIRNKESVSVSEIREKMQGELLKAPDVLQAELKEIPERIKASPDEIKKVYQEKQSLIKDELQKRDKITAKLLKENAEMLKKQDEKIASTLKELNKKEALEKSASGDKKTKLQIEIAELDKKLTTLVLEKEALKEEYAGKVDSAGNGKYGVRFTEYGQTTGVQPVSNKMAFAVARSTGNKVKGIDFPLLQG